MPQRRPDKKNKGMGMTADCAKIAARLSMYLDGGMDTMERDGMNRHFADCASCRIELARQRQAESALTAARFTLPQAGDLRADFYARLQTENSARSKRPAINWRLAVPALASAGLAAMLWRPGADVPMNRNQAAPSVSIAPRSSVKGDLAKAETTRRGNSPAISEVKTAPRASGHSLLRVAEAPVLAKKSPEMPAPPSPILRQDAQSLAPTPVAANTASAKETPRQIAVVAESERLKALYGMSAYSDAPESAMGRGEAFYFGAWPADADTPRNEAKRDDWAVKSGESLAFGVSRFSASLAADPGALALSAAPGLPTMLADAALDSPAPAETPVAVQIAAGTAIDLERAKAETSAPDEVDFEVRDEERGFVSRMKVTGRIEQQPDGETLTIEAEADNGS